MTTMIDSGSITGHVVEVDPDAHTATVEMLDNDRTRIPVEQVYGAVLHTLTRCVESGERVQVFGGVQYDMGGWTTERIFAGYVRIREPGDVREMFKAMADALPDDYDAEAHIQMVREMRGKEDA